MKKLLIILILFAFTKEAYVSGYAQGGYIGDYYEIYISGGASSWDYDSIREQSKELDAWAKSVDVYVHAFISNTIKERDLPIIKQTNEDIESCYGGIIEPNEGSSSDGKRNFMQCLKNGKYKKGLVSIGDIAIEGSYYHASLTFVVSARMKREDVDYLGEGVAIILSSKISGQE